MYSRGQNLPRVRGGSYTGTHYRIDSDIWRGKFLVDIETRKNVTSQL